MKYAKAIVAALAAGLAALSTGLTDGVLTPLEIGVVLTATLSALGIVYRIPNRPPS